MTAICALTSNFIQLAAARIGVCVGEAGGSPPAVSLISSYYPRHQRSTAMAIYSLGPTVGILVGFVIGGWVNQFYGWRVAMLVVGLPGIILAIMVKLMVKEPLRSQEEKDLDFPSQMSSVKTLFAITTYTRVNIAATAAAFSIYAFMVWVPVYLIREFGMSTGEVGTAVGLIAGFAGSIGVFLGGYLADFLSRFNDRWQMRMPALTTLIFMPLVVLVLFAPTQKAAIVLMIPTYMLALAYTGPTWAILQSVVPLNMRAMGAAIMLFLVNLIGLGFGPQLVGILSDVLQTGEGNDSLRIAIALASSFSLLASFYFYLASKSMQVDLADPMARDAGTTPD
jgi:MFS family permease